jgi:hypothetical protein
MSAFLLSILIASLIRGRATAVSTAPSFIYDSAILARVNAYSLAGGVIFYIFL